MTKTDSARIKRARRPAKERLADDHQQIAARSELHDLIDHICDSWQAVQHQADTMGRGYPAGGDGGSSDTTTIVERIALDDRFDPGEQARNWLAGFTEMRAQVIVLSRGARSLVPDQPTISRQVTGAECEACRRWVPGSADDRLRSGFCDACRKSWDRFSALALKQDEVPDRAAFIILRSGRSARQSA